MARAAVKAKQQAARSKAAQQAPKRGGGRRRHAGGGNPNQQLFFERMRRHAKWAYVVLALLFAITFTALGVGSGSNSGLDQIFSGLHIFGGGGGTSISKAQAEVAKNPKSAKAYRDLATAFEAQGQTGGAIGALVSYTNIKKKDAAAWSELGGLQLQQAQSFAGAYQSAASAQAAAAPSQPFLPSGTLGTAIGTNPIEQAASQSAGSEHEPPLPAGGLGLPERAHELPDRREAAPERRERAVRDRERRAVGRRLPDRGGGPQEVSEAQPRDDPARTDRVADQAALARTGRTAEEDVVRVSDPRTDARRPDRLTRRWSDFGGRRADELRHQDRAAQQRVVRDLARRRGRPLHGARVQAAAARGDRSRSDRRARRPHRHDLHRLDHARRARRRDQAPARAQRPARARLQRPQHHEDLRDHRPRQGVRHLPDRDEALAGSGAARG